MSSEWMFVHGLAAHQRVDTAGVVADHAAQCAATVGGRVGRKGEMVLFCGFANAVENDARLDIRELLFRIEPLYRAHVLRKIEHDGHVAALPGKTGAPPRAKIGAPN